jgi:gas vesicle protein GvpL/GvpF
VIELYAIAGHPGPPLPGIASLRAAPVDGLAAVYGPAGEDREVTDQALWRHEEIVEALMEGRDLLPVRYGTRLTSEDEAVRVVATRAGELRAALDHVRGAVELALRVRAREPRAAPDVHPQLRQLARDAVERPGRDELELLRNAYLVERERVSAFSEAVDRLQRAHPDLALLLTGPWPPYSFTDR